MRLVLLLGVLAAARPARAEPLPSGAMGLVLGAVAGTGADASRLGYGYVEPLSFQAAWHTALDPRHPMDSDARLGWAVRWSTIFASTYGATAAQVTSLETVQMDITLGLRVRPGASPRRYLTARGGPALFRANQTIPPKMARAFIGPVASVGLQQYLLGTLILLDFDVRYGLMNVPGVEDSNPSQLAFTAAISITGP